MSVQTKTIETWVCDNCHKIVEKVSGDYLGRHFPPEGWLIVEEVSVGGNRCHIGGHACNAECRRILNERVIEKMREILS